MKSHLFKKMNDNLGLLAIASLLCLGCNVESTTDLTFTPQATVQGDAGQDRDDNELSKASSQRVAEGAFGPVPPSVGTLNIPKLKSKPKYCLFEFGSAGERKIWLVTDGTTIYVDRNSNGDLTEPGERVSESDRQEGVNYRAVHYKPIDVSLNDTGNKTTELEIGWYQQKDAPIHHFMKIRVDGKLRQYAGWREMFSDSQANSSIFKFGGKYSPVPLRTKHLYRDGDAQELHLAFAIAGNNKQAKTLLAYEAVPKEITPVAEIQWPAIESAVPIRTTVNLTSRC